MGRLKTYLINIAIAADFMLNALLAGDPAETLTRRMARAGREGRWYGCVFCRLMDLIDTDHCRRFG